VVDRRTRLVVQPPTALQEFTRRVGAGPRLAKRGLAAGARGARAAGRYEHHHDLVAERHVEDARPRVENDARRLVPERHRHRAQPRTVDHREVGVTQASRLDPHQQFTRTRVVEVELDKGQRERLGIRRSQPRLAQHCGGRLHLGNVSVAGVTTPERPPRDSYRVLRTITTRWSDEDVYGHVNNVAYYSYVDTAVNSWLMEATGVDIRRLPQIGIVVESGCSFHAPLAFPADVTVGIGLTRLGRSSVEYAIGIFGASAEPAASVRFVHVYVDAVTRKPVAVPAVIRSVVAALT